MDVGLLQETFEKAIADSGEEVLASPGTSGMVVFFGGCNFDVEESVLARAYEEMGLETNVDMSLDRVKIMAVIVLRIVTNGHAVEDGERHEEAEEDSHVEDNEDETWRGILED